MFEFLAKSYKLILKDVREIFSKVDLFDFNLKACLALLSWVILRFPGKLKKSWALIWFNEFFNF